jgi:CheY-like chemotaxis protein
MLAHELRNPLAPLRNALHLLRLRGDDGETRGQLCEVMDRQLSHLTRLVDDLLDVSRITRGQVLLHKEGLDLAALVRAAVEDHRAAAEAAGLALTCAVPARPVCVQGDPTRLAQVMDNLLTNAVKFTEGGGRVGVRLDADEPRGRAVVTVRDSGIGIDGALLPHLFETFTQADHSLDRSRGGLGLGLSLVQGLVELHGGRVRAESDGPGRGSAFRFWLPLAAEGTPPAPRRAAAGGAPARVKRRVLLVEDNADAAFSLRLLLELAGHEVTVAHDGRTGLETALRLRPDVVLCDLGLPELDGFEVARALRGDPDTAGTYLVAVSGYGQDDDRRRSREAGFDTHLTKPVDPCHLQRLLDEWPGRGERGASAPR